MGRQLFEELEKNQLILLLDHLTSSDPGHLTQDRANENQAIVNRLLASFNTSAPGNDSVLVATEKIVKKTRKKFFGCDKFDISKYRQRQLAFHVQYDGTAYAGFASQDCEDTVENHLFKAFLKLRLIADRQSCNYSRCGRTDRGVSALGQVISLRVRSSFRSDLPDHYVPLHPCDLSHPDLTVTVSGTDGRREMDYCSMLNRSLPEDIRILGWTEVTPLFSARFSAAYRTYRYFFIRNGLDIAAMQRAAEYLVGCHDFSNFCKMDVANVSNFRREIYSAQILPFSDSAAESSSAVWMFEIRGIAFLWHMVRCIMAVLFMVGGKDCDGGEAERPEVVQQLLDTASLPSKPSYSMAPELPLVLHRCGFDRLDIPAHSMQPAVLWQLTAHFRAVWEKHALAAARAENALQFLRYSCKVRTQDADEFLQASIARQRERLQKALSEQSGCSRKRKVPASSASSFSSPVCSAFPGNEGSHVVWGECMQRVKETTGQLPRERNAPPHTPLLQRKREGTYEDKVKGLSGNKKGRFERHKTLQEEGGGGDLDARRGSFSAENEEQELGEDESGEDGAEQRHSGADSATFFARMRAEGALLRTGPSLAPPSDSAHTQT